MSNHTKPLPQEDLHPRINCVASAKARISPDIAMPMIDIGIATYLDNKYYLVSVSSNIGMRPGINHALRNYIGMLLGRHNFFPLSSFDRLLVWHYTHQYLLHQGY